MLRIGPANTPTRSFLSGQAVFQMSIEQSGGAMQVAFDAAYTDGHGAAPEGEGPAQGFRQHAAIQIRRHFRNSGTGTITRRGRRHHRLAETDPRRGSAVPRFLQQNMRLKRARRSKRRSANVGGAFVPRLLFILRSQIATATDLSTRSVLAALLACPVLRLLHEFLLYRILLDVIRDISKLPRCSHSRFVVAVLPSCCRVARRCALVFAAT